MPYFVMRHSVITAAWFIAVVAAVPTMTMFLLCLPPAATDGYWFDQHTGAELPYRILR
jgi:hypothetical protein